MLARRPIYLHFFDRELWSSVGVAPHRSSIDRSLKALILGTDAQLYCGLSLLWENPALQSIDGQIDQAIFQLVEFGTIEPISQYPTAEEFIETRRELYKHDRERYPLYFLKNVPAGPTVGQVKTSSATRHLTQLLYQWSQGGSEVVSGQKESGRMLRNAVRAALDEREDRAVTFTLFQAYLEKAGLDSSQMEYAVRRQISRGYTSHYLSHAHGDIPTGIPQLSYFDSLTQSFPDYDIHLIEQLLLVLNFGDILARPLNCESAWWHQIAGRRGYDLMSRLASDDLRFLLRAFHNFAIEALGGANRDANLFGIRNIVGSLIRQKVRVSTGPPATDPSAFFGTLSIALAAAKGQLMDDKDMRKALEASKNQLGGDAPKVLLATATEIERDTVLRLAESIVGAAAIPKFGKRRSYYLLGEIGGAQVFMVQSEMGSAGPGASLPTLSDAIDEIKPLAVIMLGIAFGVDDRKQNLSEILVSRQLQLYENAKISTTRSRRRKKIILRGDRVTASTLLLSRLRIAESAWSGKRVRFGVLLSGEKLIDNIDYRDELKSLSEEMLGGEMEGAGLYVAAVERKVDWIVVKAICDWADGEKSRNKLRRQRNAAEQAAGFVLFSLQQGGFSMLNTNEATPTD